MEFARIFFFITLPLAAYFYVVPGAPANVKRWSVIAANAQEYWQAQKDIQGAAGMTSLHYKASGRLPADFSAFLRENRRIMGRVDSAPESDVWGTPYELIDHGDTYEVVSCGADRDCDAALDNLVERLRKVKPAAAGAAPGTPPEDIGKVLKQALQ